MPSRRFAAIPLISGLGCLAVAVVNRDVYPPGSVYAGKYASGWTAYAPLDASSAPSRFDSFELWDPYLWVGAGVVMLLVALIVAVVFRAAGGE